MFIYSEKNTKIWRNIPGLKVKILWESKQSAQFYTKDDSLVRMPQSLKKISSFHVFVIFSYCLYWSLLSQILMVLSEYINFTTSCILHNQFKRASLSRLNPWTSIILHTTSLESLNITNLPSFQQMFETKHIWYTAF